jgi:hypothetical protein
VLVAATGRAVEKSANSGPAIGNILKSGTWRMVHPATTAEQAESVKDPDSIRRALPGAR